MIWMDNGHPLLLLFSFDIYLGHKYCWAKLVNEILMHSRRGQEGMRRTYIIYCMHVFLTCIVWFQLTHFHGRWRHLSNICSNVRPFRDMIVQLSEHSMMVNYSLVGWCTSIIYDIIEGRCMLICSNSMINRRWANNS